MEMLSFLLSFFTGIVVGAAIFELSPQLFQFRLFTRVSVVKLELG